MDKFIESFSKKTSAQKIIITILITGGLLFVMGVTYFLTTPPVKKPDNLQNVNQTSPTQVPVSAGNESTTPAWPFYKGDGYQISYPPDLIAKPGIISTGGTALLLSGKSSNGVDYTIEIQITSSSATPIENVSNIFKGLGYQESQVIISNLDARKFSGHIGDGLPALQETAIIFENRGKVYKIQLGYTSSEKNDLIEQTFMNILSTFKLI